MEKTELTKTIDGIIYRPSWRDTFQSLAVGQKISLSREQVTYNVARASISWIKKRYPGYDFTITPLDKFRDKFVIERVKA